MKRRDSNDYVRADGEGEGEGKETITSLAYWLTPEGINPITAAILRKTISTSTAKVFTAEFDGATKEEARAFLDAYELCAMPYWGVDELAKAINDADSGRDKGTAERAVALAQAAGELPGVFTPTRGIEWAMDRGYLFGIHARFVGVTLGTYGHPHNPLNEGPHHGKHSAAAVVADPVAAMPVQRSKAQDAQIVAMIESKGYATGSLPKQKPGKRGVKSEIKSALGTSGMWSGVKVFDKAWERLLANGDIAYRN